MSIPLTILAGPAGFAAGAVLAWVAHQRLRRRALAARRLVALLSAAAAVAAPAAPTGVAVWDAVLRALLGAGVVMLASRSRSVWWVVAAAVVAVGVAGGPPALAAGLAGLGFAVGLAATGRRMPLGGALVGAAVVQLSLRLTWPGRMGATAALAALAVAPLVASGWRRSPTRQRRVMARAVLAATVVVVLGTAAAGLAAARARPRLDAGVDDLRAGLDSARAGEQQATRQALGRAAEAFAAARDGMEAPWLVSARVVPVVSQHVDAVQHAARAGHELAVTGAETVAAADAGALRVENGRLDLDRVAALREPLRAAAGSLASVHRDLEGPVRSPWLVAPVARRLREEHDRVGRARRQAAVAAEVVARLPALLGRDQPRRYFLAVHTPSELRGSGGIIGSFGELEATGGAVTVGRFGRAGDLNAGGTPAAQRVLRGPPDYLARYARFQPQAVWQNVSMSPDFPSVAEVVAGLYPQSGGSPVGGVVFVDPLALSALLEVVGPVTVPPWPEPITAANARRVLLLDQYVRLDGEARVGFLGDVARAVTARLTSGPLPPASTLVEALAPAVRGHHLVLWSPTPGEQGLFHRLGADGAMAPVAGDFLAVSNVNAGGNKLDWFLRRTSHYRARFDSGTGRVEATLTVTLANEAPASGLPDYVIGSALDAGPAPGVNRTYLSVYSPLRLEGATVDGQPAPLEGQDELGRHVYSRSLDVPPGGSRTVVLRLAGRLPEGHRRRYRLDLRAQPLVVPETVSVEVTAGGGRLVGRAAAPLAADEVLRAGG